MRVISNGIRGVIIAPPGRKLVVADLSNIEGRVAAWLAGEEHMLQAFRDFDAGVGVDLYIKTYAASFNVPVESVTKTMRQIGKVECLMFQFGSGVGGWITGAATYGIDLDKMTEQVWDVLPAWAKDEARSFLEWLYEQAKPTEEARLKARFNLPEKTFVACDAIKRLWRKAHPRITSYWKELEETIILALESPGVTFPCRKVKIRRSGTWLRIGLPSGRELCYPNAKLDKHGKITYAGHSPYTRAWGTVHTYGGKVFENIVQAVACDQFAEPMPQIEDAGYELVLGVHDEWVCETPDEPQYTAEHLAEMMCARLEWNEGLPLAAAGFETYRYRKAD